MDDLQLPELNPEELADRLDEALSSDGTPFTSLGSNDPRIDIALTLANARHPEMSPEMLARIQSKVIAAHRHQFRQRRALRPQYTLALRWAAAAAMVIIFFGATAMPSVASSVPGDFWYPVKRGLENVEIFVAPSSLARAEVHLTQAERRINEVQVLLQRQGFDANLMIDARHSLADFEQTVRQLGTSLPREESRVVWVTESIAVLLQEAAQMELVSEAEVVALLPTVIPISTDVPSTTPTPTASPTATNPSPTDDVSSALATIEPIQIPETEEPSPSPTNTATFTPTATHTPSPTATETLLPPVTTMYALENANVRQNPARNQAIIAVLQQGAAAEVIGEDDTESWWHVRLGDGRLGWVAKFLLSLDKPVIFSANAENGANGNSGSGTSGTGQDFGCEHPGSYCNAPGQTGSQPNPPGGNGNGNGNGNKP